LASVVLSDKKNYTNPSYRSGANPLWGKKKHSLLIDSQGASNKTIRTESGTLKFENGVAALPNDERAKDMYDEIQKTEALHPNQYSLVENKPVVNPDTIHRYTFGSHPAMPWATYDELGRRVKDPEIKEDTDGRRTEQRTGVDDSEHRAGQL
jgi:hypothetical protein